MSEIPKDWVDLLSTPMVEYTAQIWRKSPAETWGILSRAIQNEEVSQFMPLYQCIDYICIIAKKDIDSLVITPALGVDYKQIFDYHIDRLGFQTSREELLATFHGDYRRACQRLSHFNFPLTPPALPPKQEPIPINLPPTQPVRQKDWLEKVALWMSTQWKQSSLFRWGIILVAMYIIGSFLPDEPQVSTLPPPNITLTTIANRTQIQATLTVRACLQEPIMGTPSAPICSDLLSEEEKDNIIQMLEIRETQLSAPCLIKGNISFETGEKIYHLPGQKFYDSTSIDPAYGERWFCTEAEAQAAGWRKSRE